MAACEKLCECPNDECEYHGGLMYGFKKNHLQINPECRPQFKGLTAKVAIILEENSTNSTRTWYQKNPFVHSGYKITSWCKPQDIEKYHGEYYSPENFRGYYRKNKNGVNVYYDYNIHPSQTLSVWVYVEEHNTIYMNWINSSKNIRPFLRNMRKLFGYDLEVIKNLKYKQTLCATALAYSLLNYKDNDPNLKTMLLG